MSDEGLVIVIVRRGEAIKACVVYTDGRLTKFPNRAIFPSWLQQIPQGESSWLLEDGAANLMEPGAPRHALEFLGVSLPEEKQVPVEVICTRCENLIPYDDPHYVVAVSITAFSSDGEGSTSDLLPPGKLCAGCAKKWSRNMRIAAKNTVAS